MNRKILAGLFVIAVSVSGLAGCAHVDIASHINKQPGIQVPVPKIRIDEPASMMALKYLSNADVPKLDVIRGLEATFGEVTARH